MFKNNSQAKAWYTARLLRPLRPRAMTEDPGLSQRPSVFLFVCFNFCGVEASIFVTSYWGAWMGGEAGSLLITRSHAHIHTHIHALPMCLFWISAFLE